ncbi:MAG: hypothetical protein F6J98_32540 [Moorea sp. SIO4G2]|nr:hypothetical protein [Moorena sp. SIO4G2]
MFSLNHCTHTPRAITSLLQRRIVEQRLAYSHAKRSRIPVGSVGYSPLVTG